MPRPHKCRRIAAPPGAACFKPAGLGRCGLEETALRLDELEALRLADLEGLYHDAAAERMGISRATFGRLIATARHKVADALLNSKMIVFKGGHITMTEMRRFQCRQCQGTFEVPHGTGRPSACPSCHSRRFGRAAAEGRGRGRCRRRGAGQSGGGPAGRP
jgi:predicted DNA-binding protein (UPF0251 family)